MWFSLSMGKCFMQTKIINVFIIFDASLHSYRPFCDFYFYTLQVPALTWMVMSALPTHSFVFLSLPLSPASLCLRETQRECVFVCVCERHSLKSGVIGNGTESDLSISYPLDCICNNQAYLPSLTYKHYSLMILTLLTLTVQGKRTFESL